MLFQDKIDTGSLILSFSKALDLVDSSLVNHQVRVAYIVWRMCKTGLIDISETKTYYMAALFHDVGAFSIKEKKSLMTFEIADETKHCERGYLLLKDNFWLSKVAVVIRYHHKPWTEWKKEKHGLVEEIVLGAQIINLADYVDRLIDRKRCILEQKDYIVKEIVSQSGKRFHKHVVDLFLDNGRKDEFWLTLVSGGIEKILDEEGPYRGDKMSFSLLLPVSELFRKVIDFRSRFTSTHSSGVAAAASKLAEFYGFSKREIEMMAIAGNFHDAGKLAIPDSILEKPDKLNKSEALVMKSHVFFTYRILNSVKGLEKISQWAGFHHERLNGTGYPFHLTAEELDIGSRILMVADLFTALVEKRPYKGKMNKNEVIGILKDMVKKGEIDSRVVRFLEENYEDINQFVEKCQAETVKEYKEKFGA